MSAEEHMEIARQYRAKAVTTRSVANTMSDENSRKILIGVAQDYERMADLLDNMAETERRLLSHKP